MVALVKRYWVLIVVFLAGESVVFALLKEAFWADEEAEVGAEMVEEDGPRPTAMYGKPITVVANPQDTGGLRIVIVEFDLYLDRPETIEEVDQRFGEINDAVLRLLGTKTIEDLQSRSAVPVLKYQLAEVIDRVLVEGKCFDTCVRMLVIQ